MAILPGVKSAPLTGSPITRAWTLGSAARSLSRTSLLGTGASGGPTRSPPIQDDGYVRTVQKQAGAVASLKACSEVGVEKSRCRPSGTDTSPASAAESLETTSCRLSMNRSIESLSTRQTSRKASLCDLKQIDLPDPVCATLIASRSRFILPGKSRQRGNRVLKRLHLDMRVASVNVKALVPGQLHPNVSGYARVCQSA